MGYPCKDALRIISSPQKQFISPSTSTYLNSAHNPISKQAELTFLTLSPNVGAHYELIPAFGGWYLWGLGYCRLPGSEKEPKGHVLAPFFRPPRWKMHVEAFWILPGLSKCDADVRETAGPEFRFWLHCSLDCTLPRFCSPLQGEKT